MDTVKIQLDEFQGIAKTMLAPFKYRVEGSLKKESAYSDPIGERFMEAIDFNWGAFTNKPAYWCVVVRTEILDDEISAFIKDNPMAVIVNLGAGLCTRYHRIATDSIIWIDIDLPEVIAFRQRLEEPKRANHLFISGSILDFCWMDTVEAFKERPMLFIAEGILMYFDEDQNKALFIALSERFSNSGMVFEIISPLLMFFKNPFISEKFKWGINNIKHIESWNKGISIRNEWSYSARHIELLPYTRRLAHRVLMLNNAMKIIQASFCINEI